MRTVWSLCRLVLFVGASRSLGLDFSVSLLPFLSGGGRGRPRTAAAASASRP